MGEKSFAEFSDLGFDGVFVDAEAEGARRRAFIVSLRVALTERIIKRKQVDRKAKKKEEEEGYSVGM